MIVHLSCVGKRTSRSLCMWRPDTRASLWVAGDSRLLFKCDYSLECSTKKECGGFSSGESVAPPWTVDCQRPVILGLCCTDCVLIPLSSFLVKGYIYQPGFSSSHWFCPNTHPPFVFSRMLDCALSCPFHSYPYLLPHYLYCGFPPLPSPPLPTPPLPSQREFLAVLRRCTIWLQSSLRSSLWPFLHLHKEPTVHWDMADWYDWNQYHKIKKNISNEFVFWCGYICKII